MKKVKFTQDYAVHRVDDVKEFDSQICSHLVNVAEVAEYTNEKVTQQPAGRKFIDPTEKPITEQDNEDKEPKIGFSGSMPPPPPANEPPPTKTDENRYKK